MKQKKTVLVLFGGVSSEHEISCLSAASVLSHMDIDKYEILKAGITKTGKWLLTESPEEMIRNGSWETDPGCREVLLSLDTEKKGILRENRGWMAAHRCGCRIPGTARQEWRRRDCAGAAADGRDPLCRFGYSQLRCVYG